MGRETVAFALACVFFGIFSTGGQHVSAQILNDNMECQLVALLPFSDKRDLPPEAIRDDGVTYYGYGNWPDEETLQKASFSLMATAEMAVTHFNERNPVIVPELADLGTCNITFPPVLYRDSAYNRPTAVNALLEISRDAAAEGQDPTRAMCAVIGPTHPRSSEGVSAITENYYIPQMAYSTIDRRLSRRLDFPTLARTITSSQDYGFAIVNFVQRDVLQRDFLAIIYDVTDYGEQYEDPLEDAEDFLDGYSTITEHIIEGDTGTYRDSLSETVDKGFHSILLATDRLAVLDDVAEVADEMGLIGADYFWMLSGDMLSPAMMPHIRYPVDSPSDRLLRGAAVFTNYDPFVYYGESDPFLKAWRQQDDAIARRLNDQNPVGENGPIFDSTEGYFETVTPTEYASFLYDSIILSGISACNAYEGRGDPNLAANDGQRHVDEIFNTVLHGASGPSLRFSDSENTAELTTGKLNGRDISGVIYGMYNVRPGPVEKDMQIYELVLTHLYTNDTYVPGMPVTGSWVPVEGAEFIFFDGTTNEPMPLKTTSNWNYISESIHILGLFLMSLALVISIGSGIWVFVMREDRIVKASQPEFLYLLCLGSTMVALSLFFIFMDEDKGMSADQLKSFCQVFPWLFVIGYQTMYLALFFKLWRLSKLLSMRRQAIQISQVMIPFGAVVSFSIIVLIIWQIVDPLSWNREITNIGEEEPWNSYGECSTENGAVPFVVPLGVIIFLSVFMAGSISWKLKDVQAELAESKWIFFGIFSHFQVWVIGIPVYAILDDLSRDASYLISAALIFTFSVTLVVLVIWPKMYVWARNNYFGGPPKSRISISVNKSQTVVSGLETGSTTASRTSTGADAARAEANARRVAALESELEAAKRNHENEVSRLKNIVRDIQNQPEGAVMEAEVEHAGIQQPQSRALSWADDDEETEEFAEEEAVPRPPEVDEESPERS